MSDLFRLIWCAAIGLFRSQAALQAEIVLLRHQLNVLRRTLSALCRHALATCPRQLILLTYLINVSHAAIISVGSLYLSPRTIMAQAIRAILLASATAATLIGRVAMSR